MYLLSISFPYKLFQQFLAFLENPVNGLLNRLIKQERQSRNHCKTKANGSPSSKLRIFNVLHSPASISHCRMNCKGRKTHRRDRLEQRTFDGYQAPVRILGSGLSLHCCRRKLEVIPRLVVSLEAMLVQSCLDKRRSEKVKTGI